MTERFKKTYDRCSVPGLRNLLLDLAGDRGIKIDPDELEAIGLSDEESGDEVGPAPTVEVDHDVLSSALPGNASGVAEIFFSAPKGKVVEADGLLWSPIAVEGQWATRPDGKGGKIKAPLQLVAGTSTNQRRKIGMQNILDNFIDRAVDDVTIPTTHNNGPLENTGFVEKLALVDGKVKGKTVKVLMAGERYTDKKAEQKVKEGSTRGRSMGLLYDYTRTDTGKSYDVALEHVALTPRPWLRGTPKLARPLSDPSELATVALALSDDSPTEDDLQTLLADAVTEEDSDADFLAEPAIQWAHEDSPEWLKQQVDDILRAARQKKQEARKGNVGVYVEDSIPAYRCREAKPGSALISDGWSDKSNYWVASISVADGKVTLADFKDWKPTKQVWVSDEREAPKGDKVPLSEAIDIEIENRHEKLLDPLVIAQMMRRTNLSQQDPKPANDPPRGGGEVDGQNSTLQLSEEAKALIAAAEAKAEALALQLSETNKRVDALLGTANVQSAATFIAHLKTPVEAGGLGLSEERGFGGMLVEIEQIMLADNGGPAVKSDHFADDKNKEGTLTVSDAFRRVFGALRTAEGSTLKLGEIITPPVTKVDGDNDGKPPKDETPEEVDESKLSDAEILARYEADHPGMLAKGGIKLEATTATTNGDGKG